MLTYRALILTLVILVFNSTVMSAENHIEEQQEVDWYSVEYIIFENNPLSNQALEPWTKEPFDMPIGAIELDSPSASNIQQTTLSADSMKPAVSKAFSTLNIDQQQLHGVVRRLSKLSSYTPIAHGGWIQPLEEKSSLQAIQIVLQAGAIQLEGTLTFHRGRYLHLNVDLQLTEMMPATLDANYISNIAIQPATMYRLKEPRRIKTSDTHYFDHPRFGVMVIVEKIDSPEAAVSTTDLIQEQSTVEVTELAPVNPSKLNEN
ncbi:MAG: CsiV family protein [Cycloclasticus sp.]